MSRQDIYGHKTKKLEKNVIQSVYQMTQEAVFAYSTSGYCEGQSFCEIQTIKNTLEDLCIILLWLRKFVFRQKLGLSPSST